MCGGRSATVTFEICKCKVYIFDTNKLSECADKYQCSDGALVHQRRAVDSNRYKCGLKTLWWEGEEVLVLVIQSTSYDRSFFRAAFCVCCHNTEELGPAASVFSFQRPWLHQQYKNSDCNLYLGAWPLLAALKSSLCYHPYCSSWTSACSLAAAPDLRVKWGPENRGLSPGQRWSIRLLSGCNKCDRRWDIVEKLSSGLRSKSAICAETPTAPNVMWL